MALKERFGFPVFHTRKDTKISTKVLFVPLSQNYLLNRLVGDCVTDGVKKFLMIYPNAPAAAVTASAFQSIVKVPAFKDEYKTESGVVKAATSKPLRKSAALSAYLFDVTTGVGGVG